MGASPVLTTKFKNLQMNIWNKTNPTIENESYICRMVDGYIKMCYWTGSEWLDMWQPTLDAVVKEWMHVPYDEL
jgi:hypothetical protein